jgi:hypothetical protein
MKYEDEPSILVIISITVFALLMFMGIMSYAWTQMVSLMPQPTPTTYETGLYVESENIQPASKERLQ